MRTNLGLQHSIHLGTRALLGQTINSYLGQVLFCHIRFAQSTTAHHGTQTRLEGLVYVGLGWVSLGYVVRLRLRNRPFRIFLRIHLSPRADLKGFSSV